MTSRQIEWIPEEAFVGLAFAVTGLARFISEKCNLSLGGWLILWYVKAEGRVSAEGPVILRYELSQVLEAKGFSNSNITKLLDTLLAKELIARHSLTPTEREALFGCPDGNRLAVTLTAAGEQKIEEFKRELRASFESWRVQQTGPMRRLLKSLRPIALALARALIGKRKKSSRAIAA